MPQDHYGINVANTEVAISESRQYSGQTVYFQFESGGTTVTLSDAKVQSAELVFERQVTPRRFKTPKAGPRVLGFETVDSTDVGVNYTTLQASPQWKAVFSGGAENQWSVDGVAGATVTNLDAALIKRATGTTVFAEEFDTGEGTIYWFPSTQLTRTSSATEIEGALGNSVEIRVTGGSGVPVPAVLKNATVVTDDKGVIVGLSVDALVADFPEIINGILGLAA